MKIGIYVDFIGNFTGVYRYGIELSKALKQRGLLAELWMNRDLKGDKGNFSSLEVPEIFFPKFRRITDLYWPGRRFKKAGLDVILCPGTTLIKTLLPTTQVVTIHDMGPFLYPEMKRKKDSAAWQKRIRQVVAQAKIVTTNSKTTMYDLIDIFPSVENKVFCTPFGTDHFPERTDHIPGGEHILAVGTVEPRKNYRILLRAYSILADSMGNSLPPLVIAGGAGFRAREIKEYADELGISGKVIFKGYVSDSELANLYSKAACLVHTAHYEGFGFILPEAFSWNLPVAAPDNTSIREYFSKAAWMMNISDLDSVVSGIRLCLDRGVTTSQQIERNRLSRTLTWDNCAERTIQVLKEKLQ